jgi:uncharacterized oxidoreductase
MKATGNTILVTGGGSGIGRALAQRWHDQGNTVIVAGRRQAALDETISGRSNMFAMTLDVESTATIEAFAKKMIAEHPGLNVLVNNAGVMDREDLTARRDLTAAETTIVTNLLGPIRLTNALIDHLRAQPDPAIVNVSSGLAFVPLPSGPTYSATKAAIHSYSVAMREQLRGKVEVIELAPPGVRTDLTPGQATRDGYMPLDDYADEVMSLFGQQPTPEEILVENVRPLRNAEAQGNFAAILARLNAA